MHWEDMRTFPSRASAYSSSGGGLHRLDQWRRRRPGRDLAQHGTISKTCSIGAPVRAAVVTTAPIPIQLRPDRAPRRLATQAGGPRQELPTLSFSELGLRPELLRAVQAQGYTDPTPVQREAIPLVLAGRDLLAGAQTGTGKTAAFVLPMLQLLVSGARPSNGARPHVRVLILTPTRELAIQVEQSVRDYGAGGLRRSSTTIYGGVGMGGQLSALRRGVE